MQFETVLKSCQFQMGVGISNDWGGSNIIMHCNYFYALEVIYHHPQIESSGARSRRGEKGRERLLVIAEVCEDGDSTNDRGVCEDGDS